MLRIVFKNGDITNYKKEDYTDYKYDQKCFIVANGEQWIGIYNIDVVQSIEYLRDRQSKEGE